MGGTFQIKHNHVLTAKQTEFVYRELNTGDKIIHTKKSINSKHNRGDRAGQCLPGDINHRV